MTTRITCPDEASADALASGVDEAGYEVAVIAEQTGDSATVYVVHTPATPEQLTALLPPLAPVETY